MACVADRRLASRVACDSDRRLALRVARVADRSLASCDLVRLVIRHRSQHPNLGIDLLDRSFS